MQTRRVDIGGTVRYGWALTRANLRQLIVLTLVAGLASGVPSWIANGLNRTAPGLGFLFSVAGFVISMLVGIGVIRISLRLHDGQAVTLRDLFSADWSLFWRYLWATLLYGLIVVVGLILLIVPGVIWAIRNQFYGYFVVEHGARPVEALRRSTAITQGVRWDLFLLGITLVLLNILGAVVLLVGLLVTIPTSYLALAHVYRTLSAAR